MKRLRWKTLALGTVILALIGGCTETGSNGGSAGTSATTTPGVETTAAEVVTTAPEVVESVPATIEPVTVTMGMAASYYTFLPMYVGIGLGLFDDLEEETGISVEFVPFQSGAEETRALATGQLDAAVSMFTEAAIPMSQGEPLTLVMSLWDGGVTSLLVSTDYEAENLSDLREELGRPIQVGITAFGSGTHVASLAQLNSAGLSNDDYELVPLGSVQSYYSGLADGRVDAVQSAEPASQQLLNDGLARLLVNGWDIAAVEEVFGEVHTLGFHVHNSFLESNPDAVRALAGLFSEVLAFLRENANDPDELYSAFPDEMREAISPELNAQVWPRLYSVLSSDGCPSLDAAAAVERALKDAELIPADVVVDWSQYLTTDYVPDGCGN